MNQLCVTFLPTTTVLGTTQSTLTSPSAHTEVPLQLQCSACLPLGALQGECPCDIECPYTKILP